MATSKNDITGGSVSQVEAERNHFQSIVDGLLEISNFVGSIMELDDILNEIVRITASIFESPVCSLFLFDETRENLVRRASFCIDAGVCACNTIPIDEGLQGLAARENRMVAVSDAWKEPLHKPARGVNEELYHAYICSPLRIQDEVIGVMTSRRHDVHEFTHEERALFETICKQAAIVIEKSKMYREKVEAERLAAISISLSEVAHYIKNLLQGMKGGIYFVDKGLKRGQFDMARKGWEVLQRGNRKIASLVENMLNYSRDVELDLRRHDINALIFEILQQIDDTAVERGVALVPETQKDLPAVEIDHEKMYDSFLNLITNAIDAIPPEKDGGLVILRTRLSEDGRWILVEIEDNGSGIPEEILGKIFNLFFSTKGRGGSGIGLAVTRKVIEEHKGRIEVASTVDMGTKFTVSLPASRPST
ncbi:GAF domain-containing protein [Candidatus Sumerlaeota bacterium]|nr:GAF domain-containing protein [Candidatus Sumerlaeota bacterium]